MDYYNIWFNLKETRKDMEFSRKISDYLGYLKSSGAIEGYKLMRRKLGLGFPELGEFHAVIMVRDLTQLDQAFNMAATRSGQVEKLHAAVYSAVKDAKFALYRDFPDAARVKRGRKGLPRS